MGKISATQLPVYLETDRQTKPLTESDTIIYAALCVSAVKACVLQGKEYRFMVNVKMIETGAQS